MKIRTSFFRGVSYGVSKFVQLFLMAFFSETSYFQPIVSYQVFSIAVILFPFLKITPIVIELSNLMEVPSRMFSATVFWILFVPTKEI